MTGTLVNLAVIMGGLGRLSVLAGLYIWLRAWLPRTVLSRRDIARKLNQLACGVTATGARGLPRRSDQRPAASRPRALGAGWPCGRLAQGMASAKAAARILPVDP